MGVDGEIDVKRRREVMEGSTVIKGGEKSQETKQKRSERICRTIARKSERTNSGEGVCVGGEQGGE